MDCTLRALMSQLLIAHTWPYLAVMTGAPRTRTSCGFPAQLKRSLSIFFQETHSPSKLFVLGNIIKETSELVQYCSDFTIWSGLKIMLYSLTSCLLSAL